MTKKLIPLFFTAAVFAFCFSSCKTETNPLDKYGPFVKNVMHTEAGAFRGFNLGTSTDTILAKESSKPTETDSGFVYYEYPVDSIGSFNITYNFDDAGLNEIQSEIFIKNAKQTDSVFDSFKSYFDAHYGGSEVDMGYTVWSVKSEKFGDVKINLSDQSADLTVDGAPGKLAIWIYPDKD